jgi:2,3-bisphosphoglycerate-dependent phosphoglycerate mutase
MSASPEQTPPRKRLSALRRRPLLTPFWLSLILPAGVLLLAWWAWSSIATTTIVVVRHAEKELSSIDDPPLSTAGEARAAELARMFGDGGPGDRVGAIYVTATRRSQQTAAPLAQRLGVTPQVYEARDPAALAARIFREHRGQSSLVVGHSNTVPELVNRLAPDAKVPPMSDAEYGTIYIVTVPSLGPAAVLRLKY